MSHTEVLEELVSQLADAQHVNQELVGELEEAKQEISDTRTTLRQWQCISNILDSTFLLM
jgi:hypothetical protein